MRRKLLFMLWLAFVVAPWPVLAQEVFIRVGDTQEIGTARSHTYAYGFSYLQGLGENLAWSVGYLNEGHVPNHKRDGLDFQGWGRINILNRRLSLGIGAGPYLYWDTVLGTTRPVYTDDHGVGAIFSTAATWYTNSRILIQGKLNYVLTSNSINTLSATIGLGYQLEHPARPGPLTGATRSPAEELKNELTFFGGRTVTNAGKDVATGAESLQYRRNLAPYLDWTIGWLNEHHPVSRTGVASEIWAGRTFFHDRLGLEIGFGPYLGYDYHKEYNTTRVNWLASISGSLRFTENWLLRGTWHRVTTNYDRDTDVFLVGLGYRF
jgi:hypothetical protein